MTRGKSGFSWSSGIDTLPCAAFLCTSMQFMLPSMIWMRATTQGAPTWWRHQRARAWPQVRRQLHCRAASSSTRPLIRTSGQGSVVRLTIPKPLTNSQVGRGTGGLSHTTSAFPRTAVALRNPLPSFFFGREWASLPDLLGRMLSIRTDLACRFSTLLRGTL